ncbi:unnamed protein product [Caenorhabditis brenneri]
MSSSPPARPCCVCFRFRPHEDEKAQKNTFTRWINFHLEEHSSSGRIEDLFEDIRDGVLLCHLIEVLTGEALAVHKGRVSKRVHHIANLTTALTVLRRRGLELINNNAADIADGNPRIVLGLIWQIILHFQIETNMILLREWGWAATVTEESTSTAQPEVVVTAPSPTLSSKKSHSKTSSLSGSKTSIASGEKAPSSPLRQRIASFLTPTKKTPKLTTQPVKQSVEQVFLRWINAEIGDLVGGRRVENMDKQWRDGVLFCALVSRWRPDVISMREVTNANPRDNLELAFNLAHQHLGIRRLLAVEDMMIEKPDKRSVITYVSQFVRMFGERSPMQGREQHEIFLSWLESTYLLCTRHDLNSQECSRIRREFIEHRPLFNTIIVTKVNYDVEELVEIEKKWDCIRETLEKYARRSERELPEPFASHATWLAGAEHILSRPLDLDANDAKKTVTMLQKLISEHQKYMEELPKRREQFDDAVKHGGLGGRPVAPEFSEPLKARYEQIEEENEPRISTLRILITHYILLQYLQHIDEKIILWRTADSVTLLLRWIKEYTQLNAENPQAKCAGYINKLTLAMANDHSSKLDKEAILKTSNEKTAETLKRFESLWIELKLIKVEWVEWETHVSQLEEIVEERRRNGIAPTAEDEQALAVITAGADQLAPKLGASARLSNNQRLDVLTNSFKKLHKTTIKIGGRLVVELEPSTSEQASKITYSWQASDELLKVEMQLRDRIQRDADSSERGPLEYRVEAFRIIRDKLVELERLNELNDKHSRDQVDTAERNMIRQDMGTIIYGLQAGEYASFVDLSCYAFVFDEYNQVPVNLTENVLSEDYVREIINRKKQILARREHNEDEIRESMRDMEECDRIIEGWQGKDIEELRATWNLKLSEFESWHEMMQQVEVLSQTIQTRLDVTVIQTIWILKERSYEIKHSELGGTLRESLEQLATTSETSVHRHLQNLELSNEQDCPDAIEFLEEVGRESVTKLSAAVDDRYIYTLHVLRTKMELFRRLQNFCDAVKILRSQNNKWNAIKISQIDQVQSEIDTLIVRLDEEWTQDANQLRAELASIHGSFFQLEFDRLNEKLNMLIHEKDKLRELMVHRRHYLTAANELITDSKTDLTQRATSSDHPDDILRATDEVTNALEIKGEELRRLGELAEMNITDLVVVALILSFRRRQLGSDGEPDVEELRRALREIIARPISEPRDVSPDAIVADILRMKDEKKRDEKTIDEIQATTLTDEQRASFAPLIEDYRRRADRHRIVFERLVLIYLDWLSREFDELEEEIGMTIQTSRAEDLRRMNSTEWNQWKTDLAEIERQIGTESKKALSAELADLHRKQESMEARINKYLTHSAKINAKLSQFEKWLKAIEEDIEQTERLFEDPERSNRFGSLFEVALAKQRLVSKLERLNVTNKEEVLRLCDRYHTIMQKLTPFQSAVGLPLHVSTNLDRNGPFQSQISVSSIASSELERPESVMSLTSSIGVIPTDVTELSPFEAKITKLLQKIHNIEDSYLKGPKPMDTVKEDVRQLEKYRNRGAEILQQLSTSNIEDAEKEGLKHRFVLMLNNYDDLLKSIQKEISEDEELSAKNQEILAELSTAEQTLQNSPLEDLDLSAELDRIQMQLDLVKVMCNKPRKYVECELIDSSREGSPQERRRRKKKVMVMVSNTITTIIHVVEERLEALDTPQNSAVQQKLVAVKENLRELDTATVTPHPPSILSPVGTENRNDLDEVKRLAAEIDRAIDTASSMYEDAPTDEDTLKSAIHLLDDQTVTLNHLHVVLDGIPEENEQDKIEAIDIASFVGEKLGNLKTVVEEVYEEIITSSQPIQEDQPLQHVQEVQRAPEERSNWDTDEFNRQPPVISEEKIEIKTDPSAIDKFEVRTDEDPMPKLIDLFGQLQTAVDEASPLACEGTSDVNALQTASDKLTKQDRTIKKIHAILETIDDPAQKPAIIGSLDNIKEQIDLARDNINRQIDNLNYNQTPVVAPKESTRTPLNDIEDAIKQASAAVFDDLHNTEKLLNSRQILSNVKPQVDAVEANVWTNPETIDIVQPVLEQYASLITSIDKKLNQEIDVPINDPTRQDLVQQLQDVIAECEDVVVDCEDIGKLEESKKKLEDAKPLLDQIELNVEKLTREASPDAPEAVDALSNVHQQYDATVMSIEDRIDELKNPEPTEEEEDPSVQILAELNVISEMSPITIDISMLDGIEENLSTLPTNRADEIRSKINELRQKKQVAEQAEQILADLDAFSELPAITYDLDLLKSLEEDLDALPKEDAEKIKVKIALLRKKKEESDQAEAVLQELNVLSELPASTLDLDMLQGIEDNLNTLPMEEGDKIREKLKELRDRKEVADQTDSIIQELHVIGDLPSSTIDLNMLQGIEDNLSTLPSEDAEKIRTEINELRKKKEISNQTEALLQELNVISEMDSSTIDLNMLKGIEDGLNDLPEEESAKIRAEIEFLRNKKQDSDKVQDTLQHLQTESSKPPVEINLEELNTIEAGLVGIPETELKETRDLIAKLRTDKALADHAETYLIELKKIEEMPINSVGDDVLATIEDQITQMPSEYQPLVKDTLATLKQRKEDEKKYSGVYDELEKISKMPAKVYDDQLLDKITDKLQVLPNKEGETSQAKVEEIKITKADIVAEIAVLDQLPAKDIDENMLNSIEEKLPTIPSDSSDQLQIAISKLRNKKQANVEEGEAEPLLAKIQELRDAKRADDEARSAAHDNLVTLEKEAEDVTAKESAKKKKKDKKKSPQEMIDELSAKVAEAKALIPKIEEAAKNEHLPADDKPKAEQLVSNLEAFIKDVETQVSEKQDELDKLNNANDAIRRLGDALDDAEKTVVPSNVTALNEFKDRIAPHLATLVEAVKEVPVSVEPSAAALRDRAAKFVSDLEKNIQKTGDDEKRAEELKNDVGNAVNNVDDVVSKYQNQTTQPLDVAKEDANKLKTAVEQLNKLAESGDKIDPQVAKDIKDSKTKAKELLQALEKAIPQEDAIRREQAEINDRLNNLEKELAKVDEFKPEDALPLVDQLATDTTTLKAVTDSNNEKAVAPSSLISHDDLVVGLPEKVFQLQHAIDDKKQALNKAAAVNEIAPKLQLVSQQLQSVPQEVPASLDEQKQLLEDVENQKHNLENLLANLPENDPAADELRQKSQWDLSRLKDLLKQLGSAVGDKLAALAAFNAARKNAEDALLDITREDGTDHNKSPDELIDDLTKKEETVAKLRETVAGVKPDELDEKERAEYNDLLARLATAADVLKNKRAELEQAIKAKAEEKSLHDAVDRNVSRLVPLVRDAEELRHNAEAVPTQYAPKAEELKKEVEAAKAIIANAPASDDHVQQLQQVVATAEALIPDLEQRARLWDEFLVARNDIDALIERLQQPLDAVVAKPKRSAEEAAQDVENLRQSAQQLPDLDNKISNLQRISELLDPLESAYADVRFFDVDAEQTRHQYDDVLNDVAAELEDETLLKQSADQVAKEIDDISKMIDSTDPERSILDTIAKSDVPALKAQINRIKDRIVNADASRKHVTTDPKIADDLDNKLAKLEAELDDAIKTSDEHDKEQLILSLKLNISQFEQLPLDQLKPDDLKTAEKEITNSLKPEEAEPLLAKIQELRDAKRADDEARSAAHDNLVTLEKEAEDVTAKESAKKKKKDKKKSPQEMIDELSAKVAEAKALIPKIEEAAKNEHLPADDKPKAEQLVSNLEAFIKDVETQVSEKQDELDKLNNANDAIRRLGDALDDAEKTVVPSNVTALNEFKDRIAPHLATLVEAVKEVPVSVEPSAAALRDRAAKFVSDLEKNIQKTGDDEKRAEELKNDVGNAVNNVDDVVSKYQNQTTQPLDVAKEDANKLKTAVEQLNKLAESGDKIDPQVAKDIKDSKTKAKELLQALEKAIPQEDAIRREQAEINDRLNNLEKELAKVDEFKPEDALPLVDQLATDTTTLKAVTDSNNEKAVAPSSLISHDDLVVGLPEKVFQLQHAIDDKKQALNKAAAVNEIAPKLQLVSQQLQSVPQEVPASLDEQKQLLEDVENQKHNLENLLANLPENDPAADELRQKSQWDLSRLKDLLKQLGSAVGDKLAALAAFNAARKNAEDALLDITREDGTDHNKSPDELIDDLTKKEETVAKLRETVAGVKPDELDEKERAEYNDLLARLATAADVLKNKRAELEQAIKAKAEEKSLHDAVDRNVSRLVPLVRDAEELRHNAEAVPTQYAPKAEELKKEVEAAKAIIANAPASDDHVQQLQQVVATAEALIPDLEQRARLWDEFLVARNDIDALIERLQQPLDAVVAKPKRSAEEAAQDVENLRQSAQQLPDLDNKISNLQRISELLDPLESAYADVRFFDVDAEQTRHQYDDVLNDVAAELEDETLLKQSADQVAKEIDDISKMIDSTDPERSILDTIAKSDVPALKAQINRIKDRIVNADASRKHVTTDPKIADDLDNKLAKLEAELDDAIKTSDEHDKEQLILSLKLNISQFEQLPLDQLKPDDLKTAEKEITNSLKPEEAEPLLAKIQELRDAKRADDEARSAAHDNLVTLEKEAEDVTAKESAKKKKKDKKKSPQEMIDELSAKVAEAKALIPKIEEAAKNEHLPADDKPKAEQLVSNLEAFIKDVETQVSEKQDELDKLNNANDAIRRLGDALDDAEKTVVPSNVTALNEFKDRIAPHLATLVEAVKEVPVSVEPSAAALRDRAAKFVSDLEKNIQKTGDDEKRAEELKNDVGNAVNNVDDVVSKYQNQTTQPLDVAKEDANKLKTAVEQLNKLAESGDKIDPQVAKDIKDSKTKAKELLQALEKAIPQEDAIRREQAEINDRLNNLEKELAKVDEFKPEDALPLVDQLATDTTTLKAVTDSNNEKAVAPSSLISHDDLVVGLPEKVFQLQHAIDDKKQALNKAAAVNEIAPKLQLVSQQLQSVPQEVPASLDEQKQLLEDVENQKHNLENLLANLPENDPAADELRQKSQWDLSRLKDLLKQLGSAVGDKLAALAAFNAARKNAEDALLDITREDGTDHNKSPDELIDDLTKKEETVAKLRETVAGVKPDELDEKERAEYNDLLARLATAADVLKNKRAELEQAIKAKAEEKSLHDAVDRNVSRLVPLVRDAEELRHNAEAVPTQYAPKAEELKKEVEAAKAIIANAPASDDHVQQLQQVVATAETLIPDLEERASIWDRFVKSKDDLYDDLEKLENTVSDVLNRPRLPVSQAQQRLNKLKEQFYLLDRIRNSKIDFDDLGEALLPLTVVEDELRFMHVHVESIERQYEDTMDKLNAEITAEVELLRTLDILSNELSQCKEDINNPTADVDELSRATMLNDAIAHLENQKVVVARSEKDRKFVESSTSTDLDQLLREAKRLLKEIEPRLQLAQPDHDNEEDEDEEKGSEEKPYDVRAAAEVLSALYPDEHPHNVLRNIGFEELPSDSESRSEFDSLDSRSDGLLSPIPDDSTLNEEQLRRQRSRWRRVLRTALPLQALLVLLMGAACLVPHCDDEYCCQLLNNFAKSFDPSLEFVNGPPPF